MHPLDASLKNTQEVLGRLHRTTAPRSAHSVRVPRPRPRAAPVDLLRGPGCHGGRVNDGPTEVRVESPLGRSVVLPPWGCVIEGPRFAAFYARRWDGRDYPGGALFTLRPVGDGTLRFNIVHSAASSPPARGRRDVDPGRSRPGLPRVRRPSAPLARFDVRGPPGGGDDRGPAWRMSGAAGNRPGRRIRRRPASSPSPNSLRASTRPDAAAGVGGAPGPGVAPMRIITSGASRSRSSMRRRSAGAGPAATGLRFVRPRRGRVPARGWPGPRGSAPVA
jgi:hypothetical protein